MKNFKELADKLSNVEKPIIDWFANTPAEMCLNADGKGLNYLNQLMTMLEDGTISDAHDTNYVLNSITDFGKHWTIPEEVTTTLFNDYHFQPQRDLLSSVVDHYYGHLGGSKYGRFSFSDLKETAQEYFIGRKKTGPEEFVEFLGLIKNGASEDPAVSSELITNLVETYNSVNSEMLDVNPEVLDACYDDKLALSKLGVKVNDVKIKIGRKFFSHDNNGIDELNHLADEVRNYYDTFVETYGTVKDQEIVKSMERINVNLQELNSRKE